MYESHSSFAFSKTRFSKFMTDALEDHVGKVSTGSRNITSLQFADDISVLGEEEQEIKALVDSLQKTCKRCKMKMSAEKTNLMTNSTNGIQSEIKVKGQKLGTVTSFKYLGAVCLRWWLKTRGSLKDCTSHSSSYKAQASLKR